MAMTMSPMTSAAMGSVPVDKAGVGSGVLNSFRQVGGSLGIALMGAILASYLHARRARQARGAAVRERPARGAARQRGITFAAALVAVAARARQAGGRARAHRGARGMTTASTRMPAAERRLAARRDGDPRLLRRQLPRHDDGGDRARGRRLGADPLPPLRVEARPLLRGARPRVGARRARVGGGARVDAPDVRAALETMGRGHVDGARLQVPDRGALGAGARARRTRIPSCASTCGGTCARCTTSSPA